MTEMCPLSKKQNREKLIALGLSWCSDQADQAVTAPGGSCLPPAEDRDRISTYCPKQPQGLFPTRECQLSTVRGCLEIPKEPQEAQSLSTSQLLCRSLVLVVLLLQLSTSACFVLCRADVWLVWGIGIYFNWNFQTSPG